jgi:phage/plasmid-like protein (TIGR03299 family)
MAHNLNFNELTGKHSFVATYKNGTKAWHGLGQYVNNAMTAEEAIKLAGLDYEVEKRPIWAQPSNEPTELMEGYKATMRMDTHQALGIVSDKYEVIQNKDCFNFFDEIIDRSEAIYETAGALGKGERIFLTAKLPEDIIVNGEKVENYFMLTNGHNGKHGLVAALTPVRVVCENTLIAGLSSATNRVVVRHHKDANSRLKQAYSVMGMASKYIQHIEPIFNMMSDTRLTDKQFSEYIHKAFGDLQDNGEYSTLTKNLAQEVIEFANTHDTQLTEATKGTLWGAYNAVSGYIGWEKSYRSGEQRMNDILFGTSANRVDRAFQLAKQYIIH